MKTIKLLTPSLTLGLFLGLFLSSCSTSNDVVSKSLLVKRKYRTGFHLNLGGHRAEGTDLGTKKTSIRSLILEPPRTGLSPEKEHRLNLNVEQFIQKQKAIHPSAEIRPEDKVVAPLPNVTQLITPATRLLEHSEKYEKEISDLSSQNKLGKLARTFGFFSILLALLGSISVILGLIANGIPILFFIGNVFIPISFLFAISALALGIVSLFKESESAKKPATTGVVLGAVWFLLYILYYATIWLVAAGW